MRRIVLPGLLALSLNGIAQTALALDHTPINIYHDVPAGGIKGRIHTTDNQPAAFGNSKGFQSYQHTELLGT